MFLHLIKELSSKLIGPIIFPNFRMVNIIWTYSRSMLWTSRDKKQIVFVDLFGIGGKQTPFEHGCGGLQFTSCMLRAHPRKAMRLETHN